MPTPTFIALANHTLTGSDSSIVFSSIPGTYRDLVIYMSIKSTGSTTENRIRFNGDASNIYSMVQMGGAENNGTVSNTGTTTGGWINPNSALSSAQFNVVTVDILEYSVTNKHKTYLSRFNPEAGYANALAVRWANLNAINQIEFYTLTNAFAAGSTFALYGIAS